MHSFETNHTAIDAFGRLKSDTPESINSEISNIEAIADEGHLSLAIHRYPWNLAVWAVMTGVIAELEYVKRSRGARNRNFQNALNRLARVPALAAEWLKDGPKFAAVPQIQFELTPDLKRAAAFTQEMAKSYQAFEASFPPWRENLFRALLLSETRVRFFNLKESEGDRRVSAWHKSIKPGGLIKEVAGEGPITPSPELDRLLTETCERMRADGSERIHYPVVPGTLELLASAYDSRIHDRFRRDQQIVLGAYTIAEFRRLYAALFALACVHEFVHSTWATTHKQYPLASAAMVLTQASLIEQCVRLTRLSPDKVGSILSDLTLHNRRYDLHVHPLIPLSDDGQCLGIVPHFILGSNPEDNILRVISHLRPDVYDSITNRKETEAVSDLSTVCPKHCLFHPKVSLTKGTPDIDFLLEDPKHSTLVIAEHKWVRSPWSIRDRISADQQVKKASKQLSLIRSFLETNPGYLNRSKRVLKQPYDQYRNVHYVTITRDHFYWPDPGDYPIIDHGVFKRALTGAIDLHAIIDDLCAYRWLPIENQDFAVRFDPAECNGVFVDLESYYPIGQNAADFSA